MAADKELYGQMSDEELIERLRGGDSAVMDYICVKYKNLVRSKAKSMFILGSDNDDLIQEGMIGLFKAVMDFNRDREATFSTFANLCISRQMYSAVEASLRKKHQPLNSYVSFYDEKENEKGRNSVTEVELSSEDDNPELLLIARENEEIIRKTIKDMLSPMENRVMNLFLEGLDYKEIAEKLGKSSKSVDNALQRIKTKLYKSKISNIK